MQAKFLSAINQICDEKGLPREVILETVKAALAAAYKKDYGDKRQEVRVEIDEDSGKSTVYISKEVVPEVTDPLIEISIKEAKKIKKDAKVGDTVEIEDDPEDFGRIAAQTAKQIIIQRIREAEREIVFNEYKHKENDLVNGTVQRIEGNNVFIDLGKATGVIFPQEQIPGEKYYIGQRIKIFVVKVEQTTKGPQILLSRSHPEMIKKLFETEVPEIPAGTVEVKSIAREAGQRSKIAVWSTAEGIDPVGSCVGQRGVRVQSVMNELGEEKIDIILWNEDPKAYISNALSPAKVTEIKIEEAEKRAKVKVPENQLSLAIGKQGQNVRLAAKLTGWNIDIVGADEAGIEATAQVTEEIQASKKDIEEEIIKTVEAGSAKGKEKIKGEEEQKEVIQKKQGKIKVEESQVEPKPDEISQSVSSGLDEQVQDKDEKKEVIQEEQKEETRPKVEQPAVPTEEKTSEIKPKEEEELPKKEEKSKEDKIVEPEPSEEAKKIQEEIQKAVEVEQTQGIENKIVTSEITEEEKLPEINPVSENQTIEKSNEKDQPRP